MCEEIEILEIPLSEVNNANIEKDTTYKIYDKKTDDDCIVQIWGDNRLIISEDGINFFIDELEPFKYYRGVLSLECRTNFYLKEINKYFENDNSVELNTKFEDDQGYLHYTIDINSTDTDIEKFMCKILGFEFQFNNELTKIEDKIKKLIE